MILSREIHRPSSAKLWQIPHPAALPILPLLCWREVPLEAQETSYLADSASIFSFSSTLSSIILSEIVFYKSTYNGVNKRFLSLKKAKRTVLTPTSNNNQQISKYIASLTI